MPQDQTTRGYPLPHPDNIAVHDVVRIRNTILHIDGDVSMLNAEYKRIEQQLKRLNLETFLKVSLLDDAC